jgi:hypothetical protein
MKKVFILLFVGISLLSYAQKFQLTDPNDNLYTNGQTITLGITENDLNIIGEFITVFNVKNLTDNNLNIKTTRTDLVLIDEMTVNLCVGVSCYPDDVFEVTYVVEAVGTEEFSFHLIPNGKFGLCKFKLDFETDGQSMILFLNIDMQHLGIKENNNQISTLSAFPNPVSIDEKINISYSIINNNEKQNLVVRNVLGTTIMTMSLNSDEHNIYIDPATLKSGLYFYAIENKNQIVVAKKLIVK